MNTDINLKIDIKMSYTITSTEHETFLLCFIAVIWKRIFICLEMYCREKELPENQENLMKCIKYNLLAPTGLLEQLRPYIDHVLEQGFLMPNEIDNIYAKRAIMLFRECYSICKMDDPEFRQKKERSFILDYCQRIFDYETTQEQFDAQADAIMVDQSFVDLVDVWDLQVFFPDQEKHPIRHKILSSVFIENI